MILWLKQGIGNVYATADFICIGIVEMCCTQNKQELQNEKFLSTVIFDPGTSRFLDKMLYPLRHGATWNIIIYM